MIKFGPSGNSESFFAENHKTTEEAASWVKERGLDYYEYSFGRGVNLGETKAVSIGNAFKSAGRAGSLSGPGGAHRRLQRLFREALASDAKRIAASHYARGMSP